MHKKKNQNKQHTRCLGLHSLRKGPINALDSEQQTVQRSLFQP